MSSPEDQASGRGPASIAVAFVLAALDLFWLAGLVALPFIWLFDPLELRLGPAHFTAHWGLKPALFVLLLPFMRAVLWLAADYFFKINAGGLWRSGWFRRLAMALAATIVFFAAIEGALAALDFKYEVPAVIFEGKNEFGGIEVSHTIPDTELLYRFEPGGWFGGRRINSMGFREREVDPVKKEGAARVICMGDSVTAQGLPGYSEYLNEMLAARPPAAGTWEAFNMAVHGYSVHQGLALFRRQVRDLKPDIVTVYFGWNDHWLNSQSDEMIMAVRVSPVVGKIFDRISKKRIFMALHALISPPGRQRPGADNKVLRVPPERYEKLLKQLAVEITAAGAVPVLITAACRPMPESEVGKERIRSRDEGNRLHQEYIAVTRKVAAGMNLPLLDLEEILKGPECDRYFAPDGIHFDLYDREDSINRLLPPECQPGLRRVAEELYNFIARLAASPGWKPRN
ncbi:MAG: SGNH/GDSL hydrolase family protein [Kiritimatiellia bacterium]